MITNTITHNRQVGLKIQLKHRQRVTYIRSGGGNGDQWQNDIALFNMILHPLPIDGDIPLKKMKARMIHQGGNMVGVHIHTVDMPIGGINDTL